MIFRIIKIAVIVIFIYLAFILTLPWIKYYIFKSATLEIISNDEKISRKALTDSIKEQAHDLNITLGKNAIKIEDLGKATSYTVQYSDNVSIPLLKKNIIFKHKIEQIEPIEGGNVSEI
ncbi:hypothetical protein [Flexistipes sp.]|uniref:hypothetical protein n=1 Tax=Flexistipes sp. TaxID=3088135 RepID=UPI002E23056B|nr:hypothetical protein [Flexistipes sp.]